MDRTGYAEAMSPEEKRRELERALLNRKAGARRPVIVRRADDAAPAPLALAQRRLWLHETIEGAGALYNMPCALRLRGALEVESLRRALELLVERHSVLRSSVEQREGKPLLVCRPAAPIALPVTRLADPADAPRLMREEADRPFDLASAPLLRARLLQLANDDHILLLTLHHIVSDGWSLGVLTTEVSVAYEAYCRNACPQLAELPVQYADYSEWQQHSLDDSRLTRQLDFWEAQLRDAPTLLPLPLERVRPPRQRYEGGVHRFVLDAPLAARLRELARRHGATQYMLLLAAFNVLLSRHCGVDDIVVGSPVANRKPRETESLIGFFVNTLVMRNRVAGEMRFLDFLQQVKQSTLAAFANQDVPFDLVVERLQPERSTSHSPLFQVEFVLQQPLPRSFRLGELEAQALAGESSFTKFDLTLSLEDGAQDMPGLLEFNRNLFTDDFAARMVGHLLTLLREIVENPAQLIDRLGMLPPQETERLLGWSGRERAAPIEAGVLARFAARVVRHPQALAVRHRDESLSYLELAQRANQLAHALAEAGVHHGERVALYLERGIDYVAAMLAVFKLGAAFVPFNPEQSASRNAGMLARARAALVLADARHASAAAAVAGGTPVFTLCRKTLAGLPGDWEDPAFDGDAPAYLLYTSGSTGEPKAAVVAHRGMMNHLQAKIDDLGLCETDVVAQIAVQTFDVSVWQCLVALLAGGRTEVMTGTDAWDPVPLLAGLDAREVTVVETVPSHLEILLDAAQRHAAASRLSALRWMISNGEPLAGGLARRWFAMFPDTRLMNAYGPTECSDDVTHLCLDGPPNCSTPYLPIGRPIANAELYVLDAQMRLAPIGVVGEIHIGGCCVGPGYFMDPARTEAAFVASPFSAQRNARLYRSGDLGRFREDGSLELLGRADFQLKIRGCRIEAGEVEAVLCQHPAVEHCLVTGSPDRSGALGVAAYVVSRQRPAPGAEALRQFCVERLPDFMVPSGVCVLDELPLLSNGKIDRAGLPPLSSFELGAAQPYIAPRDAREHRLSELWQTVLGVARVGIDDNFFQLGGHSLMAVELVNQCRDVLGDQLSLHQLFASPTIRSLAQASSVEASA
ncbi:amino acid adenylation domain-containing protein (plasmid) [Burkholderia glumae]|uniref:non-ribosomal peptide synthetase n=1 Tax=Burkholderia glumae TaxID=337 RepID=UPI0021512ACE|nr:amino acid adenylation domain-containing protein [Burkholderia glumae]UVS82799.1 amino acid adenylation domain-containing protein [Burkholderia glumae]UVT00244.1 amino acid adenylation domain-containing protein [Burkholderia glumae]